MSAHPADNASGPHHDCVNMMNALCQPPADADFASVRRRIVAASAVPQVLRALQTAGPDDVRLQLVCCKVRTRPFPPSFCPSCQHLVELAAGHFIIIGHHDSSLEGGCPASLARWLPGLRAAGLALARLFD